MKLKIKKGKHLVTSFYHSKRHGDDLLINLVDRWTYKGFKQKKNHLLIDTFNGEVDIVFCGEVPKLEFRNYEKDQVVFNCL